MFKKIDNWGMYRHDGLLYFTQRINEMLDYDTNHIYKSPVLNTQLLVDEYLKTAKMAKDGTIDKYHLVPIMDEFRFSFKEDLIIKEHIEEPLRMRIVNRTMEKYIDDWKETMEYVKNLLKDYNQWCKRFLLEAILKNKEIKTIEQGIRCFVPGMIAFGYNKDYICQYNIDVFYKRPVSSVFVLRNFLNRFDFKERKYSVYIAIKAEVKPFRRLLKKSFNVSFGPFKNDKGMGFDKREYILSKVQVSALDEYTAMNKAYSMLNEFFTYYCFFSEQTENWCYNNVAVADFKGRIHVIPLKSIHQRRPLIPHIECIMASAVVTIMRLKKKSRQSYQQINMALIMHNTAVNDSDIKNRFLDFWSVLEILFVSERKKTKLEEIKDKMLPILLKDYFRYLFLSINSSIIDLQDQIEMKSLENMFPEEKKKDWPLYIPFKEYSNQRDKLCSILNDYPLLRYRISQLSELCNNKNNFLNLLNTHSSRLLWHITRLYRTRNSIVHSGDTPGHLPELLEHLHSYTDQCLVMLQLLLVYDKNIRSISNFIVGIQLQKDEMVSLFKNDSPFVESDLDVVLRRIEEPESAP